MKCSSPRKVIVSWSLTLAWKDGRLPLLRREELRGNDGTAQTKTTIRLLHFVMTSVCKIHSKKRWVDWVGRIGALIMGGWLMDGAGEVTNYLMHRWHDDDVLRWWCTTTWCTATGELQHSLKEAGRIELVVSLLVSTSSLERKVLIPFAPQRLTDKKG